MSCLLLTSWSAAGIDETLTITFSESTHFGHACKINCTRPVTSARVANCILPSCSAPLYYTIYNVVCAMCVHTKNDSSLEDTNLFAYPTLNDTDSNHGCCLLEI